MDQPPDLPTPPAPNRRALLGLFATGSAIAIAAPALARQGGGLLPPSIQLPERLRALLPASVTDDATDALGIANALVALEREADVRRLPPSPLSTGGIVSLLGIRPDTIYTRALPRLVALVDRAERRDIPFADQAGGLLARLHLTQHETAAGWSPGFGAIGRADSAAGRLALQDVPLPETEPPEEGDPSAEQPMRRGTRFADLAEEYARLFASADARPEHGEAIGWHLTMLRQNRARYAAVGDRLAIPWYFIGATHGLEASFNFRAHMHNGDFPLAARTRQVPRGRPMVWLPPSDWESSAIDAMRLLGYANQPDWGIARTLHRLEGYNGFGYRARGVPTPYLWSFSNHYDRGKFVADGRWNPAARSQQCGAALMIKMLADAGDITLDS